MGPSVGELALKGDGVVYRLVEFEIMGGVAQELEATILFIEVIKQFPSQK